ncbi:MAG: protein translocase subunit SecD [Deltaproteobacteria bacterium]|nr:protein translocase subunit SecD [Deltaproteobacteria bacterium]
MKRGFLWRILFLLALILLGGYYLYPSYRYITLTPEQAELAKKSRANFQKLLPGWSPQSHIVPGLDLQGGIHLVLGVDLKKAIADKTERISDRLRADLDDKKIGYASVKRMEEGARDRVEVVFADADARKQFESDLLKNYFELEVVSRDEAKMVLKISGEFVKRVKTDSVDQAIKTIRNRVDKMGVAEPSINKRGEDGIQVQLPGYGDPDEAKALLGRTAQLEFQMCADDSKALEELKDLPDGINLIRSTYRRPDGSAGRDVFLESKELEPLREYLQGKVPQDLIVKYGQEFKKGERWYRTYLLHRRIELTGDYLTDARVAPGSAEQPQPYVAIEFNAQGGLMFEEATGRNIGNRMAIVLEDMVDSAPVIQSKIGGGRAQITLGGMKSQQEILTDAKNLALVLKSGALPAPVTIREERSVGPSLGVDSIHAGKVAVGVGMILVFLFMVMYYRFSGLYADLALLLNAYFLLAILSGMDATLTLPGIAGFVLTLGMAVDANVLINERIREELRLGKTPRAAVETGYGKAFWTIFDANVTTIIAALILWQYGSGPIQNFATTLMIGLIVSMFTAIFVTRIFFDWAANRPNVETLSI